MQIKNIPFYLSHPAVLASTLLYRLRTVFQPDLPWLSYGAIKFCQTSPYRKDHVFEWGSGRSSIWFGKRARSMISIESNEEWHAYVRRKLKSLGLNHVDCRFVALEEKRSTASPTDPKQPPFVAAIDGVPDGSLDLVIVDGFAYREACIQRALPKIRSGGWLLVDNTNWMALEAWGVPPTWEILHRSRTVVTETTIWRKP